MMRWTGRLVAILLVLVSTSVFVVVLAAVPARAAFPGRNGLLVVEPPGGRGLIVVGADGAHPRKICTVAARCDGAQDPVWSPDGSEIAFATPDRNDFGALDPYVIYPDGSCLACSVPAPSDDADFYSWNQNSGPGFLADGRLAVSVEVDYPPAPQLGAMNTDGIGFQPFAISGSWRQPAWSPTGRLAAVRRVGRKSEVFAIDPSARLARRLTRDGASSPTWSPDGRRLAVVHRGWIELVGAGGGRMRRLTRGVAPAWAPNGKELAFVGTRHRLFVITARGGRPRPVGHVRATRVDWQPVTGQPPSACQAPAGSSVVAASPDARVTIDPAPVSQDPALNGAFSVLGCLTSDGRVRLLENLPPSGIDATAALGQVVVAGDYAAVLNESSNEHYGGSSGRVAVYDLRTGNAVANRGGESGGCADFETPCSGVEQLVLGPDAVTAAHTFFTYCGSTCTTMEQIVANDGTGTHTLDSITTTGAYTPTPSSLIQLALSGHTLTWSHAGSPRTAQLN